MENVNDRDNQESSFRVPLNSFKHRQVFNGVEYKIPHVSSEGDLTKNPYVPHDRVPVDSEAFKTVLSEVEEGSSWIDEANKVEDLETKVRSFLTDSGYDETQINQMLGISLVRSTCIKKYLYSVQKRELPFIAPDTSSSECIEHLPKYKQLLTDPSNVGIQISGSDGDWTISDIEPDKQKMKEIKLAALESSKSLTRLLELLREYDV